MTRVINYQEKDISKVSMKKVFKMDTMNELKHVHYVYASGAGIATYLVVRKLETCGLREALIVGKDVEAIFDILWL